MKLTPNQATVLINLLEGRTANADIPETTLSGGRWAMRFGTLRTMVKRGWIKTTTKLPKRFTGRDDKHPQSKPNVTEWNYELTLTGRILAQNAKDHPPAEKTPSKRRYRKPMDFPVNNVTSILKEHFVEKT